MKTRDDDESERGSHGERRVDDGRETVAVIGLGASGEAAARLALARGAEVHVSDANQNAAVAARGDVLRDLGADVRLGGHPVDEIAAAHTIVVSPGIPPSAPVLGALRDRGVRWVSEPEFAHRFIAGALTVVTGSNGKSSTVVMCAQLMRAGGVTVALGGNIGGGLGPPASTLAMASPAPERVVLELSSFQLADIRDLYPAVGVLTGLGVDHMDRYATVADYHRDKRRLFEAGDERSTWIVNGDDARALAMAEGFPGTHLRFSVRGPVERGGWLEGSTFMIARPGNAPVAVADRSDLPLPGRHNAANALAALLAAEASGARPADASWVPAALRSLSALPHRMEEVGAVGGVRWVNDSKATNIAATACALASADAPVVLLLGGKDKGEDFRELLPALARGAGVRAVVAYGAAGPRIARELESGQAGARRAVPVARVAGGLDEVVAAGQALARKGDVLLLAPACSSYDMFADYRHRGRAFRALAAAAATGAGAAAAADEAGGNADESGARRSVRAGDDA